MWLIEKGVEEAVQSIRKTYPEDTFYAFVLSTYGDRSSVSLHANSYENLERVYTASNIVTDPGKIEARFKELQNIFGDDKKKLAKMKRSKAQELAYYKWGWMEWLDYEFIAEQATLEETWQWLDDLRQAFSGGEDKFSEEYFDAVWEYVPLCMIEAMKNCEAKGVFGRGAERANLLLYTGEYDGGEDDDILTSAKQLNPPEVFAKYESEIRAMFE